MKISRRNFLSSVTASTGTLLSIRLMKLDWFDSRPEPELHCLVLDLQSHCVLRESLHGYQAALAGEYHCRSEARIDSRRRCAMALVPGLGTLDPAIAQTLLDLMEGGTHLLLESGAGFLSPAEFSAHQRMLHRYFDLGVEPPIDLWAGNSRADRRFDHRPRPHQRKEADSGKSVPYVNYLWPRETIVRDFSRVVPVLSKGEDIIGRIGPLPVASKKRLANGTLIFLGSPLGPALRAGDLEARSWLGSVTSAETVADFARG